MLLYMRLEIAELGADCARFLSCLHELGLLGAELLLELLDALLGPGELMLQLLG